MRKRWACLLVACLAVPAMPAAEKEKGAAAKAGVTRVPYGKTRGAKRWASSS